MQEEHPKFDLGVEDDDGIDEASLIYVQQYLTNSPSSKYHHICGVMVSMLASNAVDRGGLKLTRLDQKDLQLKRRGPV